jgi:hypothetical protein
VLSDSLREFALTQSLVKSELTPNRATAVYKIKGALRLNIFLWILQVALAVFSFAGGEYKVFHFDELAEMQPTGALSRGGWGALGTFEMLCAVLLVVPSAVNWMPGLTPLAAAARALEALALAVVFAQYSVALTSTNPLVYVVVMALMAAFVAYGRYTLRPASARSRES